MQVRLRRNDAEVRRRNRQARVVRFGMVEYVPCVHTELQALGFCDPEFLAHGCIKAPTSRSIHSVPAQIALQSGKWILENNLSGLSIRHRRQSARGIERLLSGNPGALR